MTSQQEEARTGWPSVTTALRLATPSVKSVSRVKAEPAPPSAPRCTAMCHTFETVTSHAAMLRLRSGGLATAS